GGVTDPFTGAQTTYGYHTGGRPRTRTDPAGLTWTRGYDSTSGRVSSETITGPGGTSVASFSLGHDVAGNVTSKTASISGNPDSGTWSYRYDEANRMHSAQAPSGGGPDSDYAGHGNPVVSQ